MNAPRTGDRRLVTATRVWLIVAVLAGLAVCVLGTWDDGWADLLGVPLGLALCAAYSAGEARR